MSLAPWDTVPYFLPPVVGTVSPAGNTTLAVAGDPNRVLIVFSMASGGTDVSLSPSSVNTANTGIRLAAGGNSSHTVTLSDHGSLVTAPWWCNSTSGVLQFLTLSVQRWPKSKGAENATAAALQATIQRLDTLIKLLTARLKSP